MVLLIAIQNNPDKGSTPSVTTQIKKFLVHTKLPPKQKFHPLSSIWAGVVGGGILKNQQIGLQN